ncbi:hypothetical protein [Psychrobacter immobilis]|uniref:hypothetical protein n=1 Tax=Psychrobacter immobilis TaxID=498 RepID=UPI00191B0E30|nr:hypothetical protein [Psychrobacter immobilis]
MKMKYLFGIVLSTALLSACATTNAPTSSTTVDSSSKLNVSGLSPSEKIEAYSNQLMTSDNTEYATFSNLQMVRDYRTEGRYAPNPYGIYAVDGIPVKKYSNSLFGSGWYIHAAQMAVAKVKIPVGEHVVELSQITARNRSDITLPKVDYKPNTDYISVLKANKGVISIHIYTYELDDRLSRMDRDSVILKDEIISKEVDILKDKIITQKIN